MIDANKKTSANKSEFRCDPTYISEAYKHNAETQYYNSIDSNLLCNRTFSSRSDIELLLLTFFKVIFEAYQGPFWSKCLRSAAKLINNFDLQHKTKKELSTFENFIMRTNIIRIIWSIVALFGHTFCSLAEVQEINM